MQKYDYILIGSGPAAYKLSNLLAKKKRRVLVVEGGAFGGTCPNFGCEPKIFLEGAVRTVLQSQQLVGRGVSQPAQLDWAQLMQTKLQRFDPWPAETKAIIAKSHDVEAGYAKFVDQHTITVNGHQYTGDRIVIATGQHPHHLAVPGTELTHTSTDVLSLKSLPKRVAIVGAGYVAMEMATLLGAAGAQVTMLVRSDRALRGFTKADAATVVKAMEARGIDFRFNTNVQAIQQDADAFLVKTDNGDLASDYVVDASGRVPNIERLQLDQAGIDYDRHGIKVNDHLQTSQPGVYAVGDVVSRVEPKLTPVAEFEADYLFKQLEGGLTAAIQYPTIATAAFTFPEVALAGVAPDDVKDDPAYQVKRVSLAGSSLYAGKNDQSASLTLVFKSGQLVGVSAVGDDAATEVNSLTPMIGLSIKGDDFRRHVINAYPVIGDMIASLL
ncbi:dihydrolipoyl dehydrogenase family protein [Limosilactobacillus secaliphilus]|nr:NAD(P)/FAD-dependent oxidoreductase [Limosilactobacillus secaliphilus]